MTDHLATVKGIYDAFGKGDVPSILAVLAEDVGWENFGDNSAEKAGVPWLRKRQGKSGALEFFQALNENLKLTEFQVLDLAGSGRQVVDEIVVAGTTRDGRAFRDEELHLWTFDAGGKVFRLRHYVDTAKHIALCAR